MASDSADQSVVSSAITGRAKVFVVVADELDIDYSLGRSRPIRDRTKSSHFVSSTFVLVEKSFWTLSHVPITQAKK